jgi:ubiquinone/menaquinone biosynthesis C-methylase UbiE/uncharacterized protein YbaR (Trm112 family)
MSFTTEKLLATLRCPRCRGRLSINSPAGDGFECPACREQFPTINDIPRLLLSSMRNALAGQSTGSETDERQAKTAQSFGYEWTRFPEMYAEWQQSFLNYMRPHGPEFFRGKTVLDAACGNGRFAHYAAKYGAEVWAIDLGPAVEVARRNTEEFDNAQVVQADLHELPFALESFDFIYSIGALHHLPDPEGAFQSLLRYLKPEGEMQVYLYWQPEGQPIKRLLLGLVASARQVTTRLPHSFVYALAFPTAVLAFLFFVWPYQILRRIPGLRALAEKIPMKQYSYFPFRVCVNDQLDRFSAPIENRYTRQEVLDWFRRAHLEQIEVSSWFGWVGTGKKPAT